MPIKAKYNGSYKDITDLMNVDESIDYVLAKTSSSYKRVYTATRSIEDAPPTTFKSIKPGANLTDYRIYGNTSKNILPLSKTPKTETIGESVGDRTGNLFDKTNFIQTNLVPQDGNIIVPDPYTISTILPCNPNTKYTISKIVTNRFIIWGCTDYPTTNKYFNSRIASDFDSSSLTFTTGNDDNYLLIMLFYKRQPTEPTIEDVKGSLMFNYGEALPYEPYGYKVPVTVEGKNLLQNTATSRTVNGVTYTVNSDGSVTCNGQASSLSLYKIRIYLHASTSYILNGCPSGGSNESYSADLRYNDVTVSLRDIGNGVNYTCTQTGIYVYCIRITWGYTCNNLTFYPMIRKADIEDDTYEPYHTPITTPIYLPEQIRKVGDAAEYIDFMEQKQHIETTDGQEKYVVGLNVDFENKTFTRLADAIGLSKGTDFDIFSAFGGRRRCNVADNGTITAYYGDANYTEDGSNGQVMVYQPAFYYKVEPLKTEAQESGVGYHLRNVNYYISNHQGSGFKLHPAFYNEAGDRVDYILLGAYEGCIYDTSANAYITDDSQVMNSSEDKFSSIANVKPASGQTQNLTRPNLEIICKNRGNGWHSLNIRIASMEQLLMIIEFGTMNTQAGAGSNGIVFITDNSSYNCASLTGSTGSLGNTSGQAISTISDINGVQTVETANGKTAYSFRGDENPWGNIWKWVDGMNEQNPDPFAAGDRGTLYVADGTGAASYEDTGIHPAYVAWGSYTSAFGYSEGYDWLFIPTETIGNPSLPVGDSFANQNTGWRFAILGGSWNYGASAGAFGLSFINNASFRSRTVGGRLVYVPQIEKQHIYTTDLDVTLPALPTLPGTNVLSVGTAVQPSKIDITGHIKTISGGS